MYGRDVISSIGMKCTADKSGYARCGVRCSNACSIRILGGKVIAKMDNIKYLGIELAAGKKLRS
jgi:hypothetical protein